MTNQDKKLQALERRKQAMKLRLAGVSYEQIAETLGYKSRQGAWKAVDSGIKEAIREPAEELRLLELDRLDALLMALWPSASKGIQGAAAQVLRVMERRAKLMGLDAPTRTDVTSGGEMLKIEIVKASDAINRK